MYFDTYKIEDFQQVIWKEKKNLQILWKNS